MAKLQPQALGSLFVAFCDSQVYGGSVPNRLHKGNKINKFTILTLLLPSQLHVQLYSSSSGDFVTAHMIIKIQN
jgi:hypothetical protein